MPARFTSTERASLLREAAITARAHITDTTKASYRRITLTFFTFCTRMGLARQFRFMQINAYFEFYVSSEHCNKANTSLMGFIPAWRWYADEHNMFFPSKDSREFARIRRSIKGCQLRYPHAKRSDTPVTLSVIDYVASRLGISSFDDYFTCSKSTLCFMARLLVGHAACMRTMEHAGGCLTSDVLFPRGYAGGKWFNSPLGQIARRTAVLPSYVIFRVGEDPCSRKIKRRPARLAVLPCSYNYLSAGAVLLVLLRRGGYTGGPQVLFSDFVFNLRADQAAPWSRHRTQLLQLLRAAPSSLDIGDIRLGRSSLRAGGATDWFACGATREWVQAQGGWLSDAVDIYNRPTAASRFAQIQHLALAGAHQVRHPQRRGA